MDGTSVVPPHPLQHRGEVVPLRRLVDQHARVVVVVPLPLRLPQDTEVEARAVRRAVLLHKAGGGRVGVDGWMDGYGCIYVC